MVRALAALLLIPSPPISEFIFETAPFPSCHASTLVETAPGELLAAWFGGAEEGAKDVAIWGARKSGGKWSAPVELAREPETPSWNPVLFHAGGRLWLYYKFGTSPQQWTGARRFSTDGGKTWSPVEHLAAGVSGPIKDKPVVLANGHIVSGTSVESYHSWASWVERSEDDGRTWTRHGPIVSPGQEYGSIQPTVLPLAARLRMFVRTDRARRIAFADSTDEGKTWTPLQTTSLPNPNSGIDAVALKDGRIVLVYNHTEKGRSPLNLAVSTDGEHWNSFLAIETEPGEYSYPAIIQTADGNVHVTYTWKRKRIKHV